MDKIIVVWPYDGIQVINKKKWTRNGSANESHNNYAEKKTQKYILRNFTWVTFQKTQMQTEQWGKGIE